MLQLSDVTIAKNNQVLISDLNLTIAKGEIMTLMGGSGSGKSTLLSWILGALPEVFQAQGQLQLNSRVLNQLPIEQRRIGVIFQDDVLFPHWSVGQNLAFALPNTFKGKARREYIEQVLGQVGLGGFYVRDPATLSGGQRSRVSVLRALVAQPQALLLDEPFAKLDRALRAQVRDWVFEQVQALQIPVLLVTHDHEDVPAGGRVVQLNSALGGKGC
ncbi:MAG: ATP-binding cassette domain-containing protein [Thiofilum sp.]|uniref:ATP-binding cassette domain-containing protein n=1 Tax=Thiofilum sp. TaxID=2212733 RepID=UPI002600ECD4|nr:ATP-binding cassette domain-containing protein [Thiofilum sp.]MBK8454690.1 ATP-binding cassette domain-containing protein [Thiofilum sp.]